MTYKGCLLETDVWITGLQTPSFSGCSPRFPVSPEIPNIKSNISTPGSERRNARFNADNCPCPELERYKPEFLRRLLEGWEKWQNKTIRKKNTNNFFWGITNIAGWNIPMFNYIFNLSPCSPVLC